MGAKRPFRFGGLLVWVGILAQAMILHGQPAAPVNRVLDLDGKGGFVELPPMVFTNLTEATIESWVKFGTQDETRFYSYGGMQGDLCLGRVFFNQTNIQFFVNNQAMGGKLHRLEVPDRIRVGRWYHVAAVCTRQGMQLHLNGMLVATNDVPLGFHSTTNGPHNIGLKLPLSDLPTFTGQVDEFRVWKAARSAQQIQETMNTRLTGSEPGLAALWNFDDAQNPGRDGTTNGYHGRLLKGARTVELKPGLGSPFAQVRRRKVLDLDGNGSYAELPENIFTNLTDATIEARVRWFSFRENSRIFDFGALRSDINVQNRSHNSTLHFEIDTPPEGTEHNVEAKGILRIGEWVDVAAVSGSNGMKLYVSGILVGTNAFSGTIASLTNAVQHNLLGRSNWKTTSIGDQDFHGQIDEVRVWNVERTPEQIRDHLATELSGTETNLVGLWTFEDGTMRDVTPRANHGRLIGNARLVSVEARVPGVVNGVTLSVSGKATDSAGQPLREASVWLEAEGRAMRRGATDTDGNYALLATVPAGELDLCVQSGEVGGRASFNVTENVRVTRNLNASPNVAFTGTISAYGEKPAQAGLVVQALRLRPGEAPMVAATVTTDDGGGFKITNLKPGEYQLRYQTAVGFAFFEGGKAFHVDGRGPVAGLNVRMGLVKRGVWRTAMAGGTQTAQGGQVRGDEGAAVLVEASGLVWSSSSMGVMRFDGREMALLTAHQHSLIDNRVRSLLQEPDGTMWFGTASGVTRWDGVARNYTATNGLIPGAIRTMARGPDGTLWFGGDEGLTRYDGSSSPALPLAMGSRADGSTRWS